MEFVLGYLVKDTSQDALQKVGFGIQLLVFATLDVCLNFEVDIVKEVLENSEQCLYLVLVIWNLFKSLIGSNKLEM